MKTRERERLLQALTIRFESNMHRHRDVAWARVQVRLDANPDALKSLLAMESTGGEPDVIGEDRTTGEVIFCDCSTESPAGRRGFIYGISPQHT
jgi:hypothetical protein